MLYTEPPTLLDPKLRQKTTWPTPTPKKSNFILNLFLQNSLSGIYERVHEMFGGGGPNFDGRNEILLLSKALKFRVIFQKYALNLIKIWSIVEKIREKMQFFPIFLIFWRDYGKTKESDIDTL